MAPSTALLFLLVALTLLARLYRPESRRTFVWVYAAALVTVLIGLLVLLRSWCGWDSPLEVWLAREALQHGHIVRGQMSAVTGALFLLSALALLAQLPPHGGRRWARWSAVLLGGLVVGLAAGSIVSYITGQPWAFGTPRIPMALPTAWTFVFLGLALLTLSPSQARPLPDLRPARIRWQLPLLMTVLMGLLISLVSAVYLRYEQANRREEATKLLKSISGLKAEQIKHWREDYYQEAWLFSQASYLGNDVEAFLANPTSVVAREKLLSRFGRYRGDNRFTLVALLDTNFVPRLMEPETPGTPPPNVTPDLRASLLRERRLLMTDLHFTAATNISHLDLVFPVFPSGAQPDTSLPPLGYIYLRAEAAHGLDQILNTWAVPSQSAETLLVRREGSDVLFLNELRHQTNTALKLRLPLEAKSRVPAVLAELGHTGVVDGIDYRGEAVVADIRSVAGSHWHLITKIDRAELLAPLWRQAWLTLLLSVALTGVAAFAFWVLRKQREVRVVTHDLALERERRALAERVEHLMKGANDIIVIADERWNIVEANDRAAQAYGYPLERLRRMRLVELRAPATRAAFELENRRSQPGDHATFETIHLRSDGTTFPVEVSARKVVIGGVTYHMGITRDISERKAHEREIERLTRLYATLSQINQSIVRVTTREELFREICRVTVEFSGFNLVWIGWLDPATHEIVPVGSAGDDKGYLDKVKVYADERPEGQGPCGCCLRENRTVIFNNFVEDERALPWRQAALIHGLRAMMALPLRVEGKVCGTLAVYADEPDVFQDKERALLEEAAVDISFAIEHIDNEQQRTQAEAAVAASNKRLQSVLGNIAQGYYALDKDWRVVAVNAVSEKHFGKPAAELIGGTFEEATQGRIPDNVRAGIRQVMATGQPQHFEVRSLVVPGTWAIDFIYPREDGVEVYFTDITERKLAEEALRVAEQKYRSIFENTVEGIYQSTPEGKIISANPAMATIHGYATPEEFIAGIYDAAQQLYVDPAKRAEFRRLLEERGEVIGIEHEVRRKDGRLIWVSTNTRTVKDASGKVLYYEGTIEDITTRKQAELTLRENEERLRTVGDNIPGGAIYQLLMPPGGPNRYTYMSAGIERIFGLPAAQVLANPAAFWELIHEEDRARLEAEQECAVRGLTLFDCEFRQRASTGETKWIQVRSKPHRLADGALLWDGVLTDITERKRAEAALRQGEERFRAALEFLPIPIGLADSSGRAQYFNQAFTARYGYTLEDVPTVADWFLRAYPDEDYRKSALLQWEADVARALQQGQATPLRLYGVNCKDGDRRDVEITMRPVGALFIASFNDITDRKQAVAAMQQSEEQFRAMFEMASIGMAQADPHNGRFLRVNQKMCAITGYSAEELLSKRVRDITHPDDRAADGRLFQRVIKGAQSDYQVEKRYIRKDGTQIWVNVNMTLIRSAQGRPLRTMATIEDITGRKQTEQWLRENEERYRSLFENLLNGFAYCQMLYDDAGRPCDFLYLMVNKAFETHTGLKNVPGKKVSEVIPGILETDPDLIATYGRVAMTGTPEKIEVYVEALRMWFDISIYSPRQGYFVAVFDVVTERKQLEEEREITVRLLSLLNAPNNLHELMRQVTLLLHDWFGCEAVGIRLREGEDFPYFETHGFPAAFVRLENHLCECDAEGRVVRDAGGQPVLECMCGNVLRGRFDPAQPFFTARGSFWSNNTTRLLATTTAADRQANTRNRCNGEGYESVALVALRAGSVTFGLLQVNDKRKDRFTAGRIALLERLADSLAIGIAHRRDRARLQESEARYRILFDSANDVVLVHPVSPDAEAGHFIEVNEVACKVLGYTREELLHMGPAEIDAPQPAEHLRERVRRIFTDGGAIFETTHVAKDGRQIPVEISAHLFELHGQQMVLSIARDLTERKRVEAALRESEEQYRRLVDNASEAIYVAQKGIIKFANRMCARLTGYSELELVGRPSAEFAVPEERDHVARYQQRLAKGEIPADREEFKLRFRDGREHWLSISSVQIQWQDQPATLNFATDITGRKRAEAVLQLQSAALAAAANAIVITDAKGAIEWANPAFTTFTGYTLDEAQGKNPRDLIKSGQHDEAFYKELWNTILAGRVWHGEMINRRKNSTLYTEDMTITPLRDAGGVITHFIAIKQDITERKNLETHLLRTQRLESVGRLASGVAHDLNNILAPMLLAPPLLREALRDSDACSMVDTIESAAQRGASIVKQLLTFGRGLKGERIPLQLGTLVREMLKLMRETFPKDISLRTRLSPEVPLVTGDATQLHQVLMNLCVNARDAMPVGGELLLSLEPVTLDPAAAAAIPGARTGSFVVLGVSDSGSGIAPEHLDKIFDPFFTTKPIGEGTGLGLSTVLGIVRSHAGFVQVQSATGKGTSFRVFLPVSASTLTAEAVTVAASALPQGHGELVLVVDDEESLRSMARRILEGNGYRVSMAQDGAEALQMLEGMRDLPRVVLTDLIMPRMDGLTFIRTMRQQQLPPKIIAMGGLPPPPKVLEDLGLSQQNFIAKPFNSARLLTALHAVLA